MPSFKWLETQVLGSDPTLFLRFGQVWRRKLTLNIPTKESFKKIKNKWKYWKLSIFFSKMTSIQRQTELRNNFLSSNTYLTLINELNITVCIFSFSFHFNGSNTLSRIKYSTYMKSKSPSTEMAHNLESWDVPVGCLLNKHMNPQLRMQRTPHPGAG